MAVAAKDVLTKGVKVGRQKAIALHSDLVSGPLLKGAIYSEGGPAHVIFPENTLTDPPRGLLLS